eukprot:scaffold1948_cov244-Pinguiococcus_pyrenoidosus.AAC.1
MHPDSSTRSRAPSPPSRPHARQLGVVRRRQLGTPATVIRRTGREEAGDDLGPLPLDQADHSNARSGAGRGAGTRVFHHAWCHEALGAGVLYPQPPRQHFEGHLVPVQAAMHGFLVRHVQLHVALLLLDIDAELAMEPRAEPLPRLAAQACFHKAGVRVVGKDLQRARAE